MILYHCHVPMLQSQELHRLFYHSCGEGLDVEDLADVLPGYLLGGAAPQ